MAEMVVVVMKAMPHMFYHYVGCLSTCNNNFSKRGGGIGGLHS
jgi:hypothetical protein